MYQDTYAMQIKEYDEFLLNMQILADRLEDSYNIVKFFPGKNLPVLKTIRYYRNGTTPSLDSVYILWSFQVNELFKSFQDVSLIIIGEVEESSLSSNTSYIILSEDSDINNVYDHITDVFLKYASWNLALQRAYFNDFPLQEMVRASIEIFKNPIFVHDSDFYILACPNRVDGMTEFMTDSRTGRPMVTLDLINAYKIDEEYLGTLTTYGPQMFYANPRNYRILYINLWNSTHYEGRICINELQTLIKPGDYLALEHLGKMIVTFIAHRNVFWTTMGQDAEILCRKVLDRTITDEREIARTLKFLNWTPNDTYLIIKLGTNSNNADSHFSTSTFGYIESQIADSHAFFYDSSIVVIVNQTMGKASTSQIVSDMAYLLREGLFKMGVSDEINDFTQIHIGYRQASIALEYGVMSESTSWCYHFKEYALDYIFHKSCENLGSDYLCAPEIQLLLDYDKTHNSNLSPTLETYLNLERNVVQTAKALFIHRSTLFYRLDRITQLTGLDLDDVKVRLFLQLSYRILQTK